jgi:Flp pilus assembly protein TadD
MSPISPRPIVCLALAGVLALAGCKEKPQTVSNAVGSSLRSDPWEGGLNLGADPTPTATPVSPGATDFVGGPWNGTGTGGEQWKSGPKLDFGASPPPQAAPAGTAMNPFIGVDFQPGTGNVTFGDAPGSVTDILAKMRQADDLAPIAEYERMWVQARDLVAKDQIGPALTLFEKMRQLNPKDARAQLGEGIVHLRRKDYKHAVASFEVASRANPKMLETYHFLAQAQLAVQNPSGALSAYAALLRQSPDNTEALLNRVNLLFQMRQYAEMIADAETLIRTRPTMPEGFLYRGVGYLMTRRSAEAQRDFEESVRLGLSKETEKILRPRFFPVVP